jgi:hypothetical protein
MKERLIVLTDERIIVANAKSKQPRFVNKYSELQAITKSIRIAATNFIIHFGKRAEEEWYSPRRDEMLAIIVDKYLEQAQKALNVYGLGSASLEDFVTNEKDMARRITRIPGNEFLLSRRQSMSIS